jgi:hypothetical protein
VLIAEIERLEAGFALNAGAPDLPTLDAYQRAANTLRRLLEAVGLQRRARDVTPALGDYLRNHEAREIKAEPVHCVSVPPGGDATAVNDNRISEAPMTEPSP